MFDNQFIAISFRVLARIWHNTLQVL